MRQFILVCLIFISSVLAAQNNTHVFVFLNKKENKAELPKEEVDKLMKGHMDNMGRLANEGKLIAAGPFDGGGGIFIFKTTSIDSANAWLKTDPGVQANRWDVEVLPYTARVGAPCIAPQPYQMVNYHFVRFVAQVTKSTTGNYPDILKRHDEYIKTKFASTGNIVAEGVFGSQDGGILILKGDLQPEIFDGDPGVQEMLLQTSLKKLYIAKGSFCEK
jgi:uncharacterized protein YciI